MIIDTAAATKVITSPIEITKIRWILDTGSEGGDTAVVKDGDSGRVIYESVLAAVGTAAAAVLPDDVDFSPPLLASGLIIDTLAAGTKLYIYHDGPNPLKTT